MICQRTTSAVIHVFTTRFGFNADVYLDDFYGAQAPESAYEAFHTLQFLFEQLGLESSPDKDCFPSTKMVCLGIEVDTETLTLHVPKDRVNELSQELHIWRSKSVYTRTELQSLLGKLSFVTACVRPGRIFMSRLLNMLRQFPVGQRFTPMTSDIIADIDWWMTFLPRFNGSSMIKPPQWLYEDFHFNTDACLVSGGATCLDQCFYFTFPQFIIDEASHISALELYVVVVAVRVWSKVLSHKCVLVSLDNSAAVSAINSGVSKDIFMQRCLRQLWFTAAIFDFELRAEHVPGIHNSIADALSRWNVGTSHQAVFYRECAKIGIDYQFVCVSPEDLVFQII